MNNEFNQIPVKSNNQNGIVSLLSIITVVLIGACAYLYFNKPECKESNTTNNNVKEEAKECEKPKECEVCISKVIQFDKNKTNIDIFKNLSNEKLNTYYDIGWGINSRIAVDAAGKTTLDLAQKDIDVFKNDFYRFTVNIKAGKHSINNSKPVVQVYSTSTLIDGEENYVIFFLLNDGTIEKITIKDMLQNKLTPTVVSNINNAVYIQTVHTKSATGKPDGIYVIATLGDGSSKLVQQIEYVNQD